jgi:hypothetical protein
MFRATYIYDYNPGGNVAGKQVRFKRIWRGRTETTSQYFSIANFGTLRRAYVEAVRWRDRNIRWMNDRSFKPKYIDLVRLRDLAATVNRRGIGTNAPRHAPTGRRSPQLRKIQLAAVAKYGNRDWAGIVRAFDGTIALVTHAPTP